MKNENIIRLIRDRFGEQKPNAEYQLQLNKVVDKEDAFCKDFTPEQAKQYLELDIEKWKLHDTELDQLLDFAIDIIKEILTLR